MSRPARTRRPGRSRCWRRSRTSSATSVAASRRRWGPRELDLDLLVFGRARIAVDRPAAARSIEADTDPAKAARLLVVPHPAADTRLFVLAPLADLAPGLVPPGWGRTVESARRAQASIEGPDAVRPIATWDGRRHAWTPAQPR